MSLFIRYFRAFKWFVIVFLAIIALIVIPINLREHQYLMVLLVILIGAFILAILFGLNRYFFTMASSFCADKEYAYFSFAHKESLAIVHSQILKIKRTPLSYIFLLENNEEIILARVATALGSNKNIDCLIQELYAEIIL